MQLELYFYQCRTAFSEHFVDFLSISIINKYKTTDGRSAILTFSRLQVRGNPLGIKIKVSLDTHSHNEQTEALVHSILKHSSLECSENLPF